MFKYIRPLYSSAALACLMLMSSPAQAATATSAVIDFEPSSLTGLYFAGESFEQAGYTMTTFNDAGTIDLAGALGAAAPTGNATQFFSALNEGGLRLERSDGALFSMSSFDLAFVPLSPPAAGGPLVVFIAATKYADNSGGGVAWLLDSTTFQTLNNPLDFTQFNNLKSVEFFACSYDGNFCTVPLQNNGQFALDNISVTAVPEPSAGLLLGLGLATLAWRRRALTR